MDCCVCCFKSSLNMNGFYASQILTLDRYTGNKLDGHDCMISRNVLFFYLFFFFKKASNPFPLDIRTPQMSFVTMMSAVFLDIVL